MVVSEWRLKQNKDMNHSFGLLSLKKMASIKEQIVLIYFHFKYTKFSNQTDY